MVTETTFPVQTGIEVESLVRITTNAGLAQELISGLQQLIIIFTGFRIIGTIFHSIYIRLDVTGIWSFRPVLKIHQCFQTQSFGNNAQVLIQSQWSIQSVEVDFLERTHHIFIRIGSQNARFNLSTAKTDETVITLLLWEVSGKFHRICTHNPLVQVIAYIVVRTLQITDLCHHAQINGSGIGQFIGDVVLKIILPLVNIGIIEVVRCIEETCIMVSLKAHIVSYTRTTTRYIHIGTLVIIARTEYLVKPVHIGIYIRISTQFRIQDLVFTILGRSDRGQTSGLFRFIVSPHISSTISKFRYIYRTEVRSFQWNIDSSFRILLPLLGGYQHYTVCTAVTVDSSCRSVFQ